VTAPKSAVIAPVRTAVVILFAEMRGFTRTSGILEPSVVIARVSEFLALVCTAVDVNGGAVRSVLNDTLMASFTGDGMAARAVRAAQKIQHDFNEFEETLERNYGIRAALAMGLHADEAVIGSVEGSMIGEPLIIGDSVSVAERLLHRARAGEYVLSKAVVDALAGTGVRLDAEELPRLQIPRREPIQLYGVVRDTRLDFT
jgi:adenylate cyclase